MKKILMALFLILFSHISQAQTVHTIVDQDSTQTLTNKTLTAPTITNPAFSGTATGSITIPNLISPSLTSTGIFTTQDIVTKGPWVDVRIYTSFNAAITAIGSTPTTLLIPNNQFVSSSVTIDPHTTLWFLEGGMLTTGSGVTISMYKAPIATSTQQIFSGTDSIRFPSPGNAPIIVYPAWWGGKGDSSTDNTNPFNYAINSINISGITGIVQVPSGAYKFLGTINMVNVNYVKIKGSGMETTVLYKTNTGNLIEYAGLFGGISDLSLSGVDKTPTTGLYIKAQPQPGVTVSTFQNVFERILIRQFKEGIREGHYSTLNGISGDLIDPNINGNSFNNLNIVYNDYSLIDDGQNILNNKIQNLIAQYPTYYNYYSPRGGFLDISGGNMGYPTLNGLSFPTNAQIYAPGGANMHIRNVKTVNLSNFNPPFISTNSALASVLLENCDITNSSGTPTTNVDLFFGAGGQATLFNNRITGRAQLAGVDFVGINNTTGSTYLLTGTQSSYGFVNLDSNQNPTLAKQIISTLATGTPAFSTSSMTASSIVVTQVAPINPLISITAPTISSGFGTLPSIVAHNGPASFRLNVGIGGTATNGIVGLPAATNGWNCQITDTMNTALHTIENGGSTTTVNVVSLNSAGAVTAWTAATVLIFNCFGF